MSRTKWNIVLALVVCGSLLLTGAVAQQPVERPMTVHGISTVTLDLVNVGFDENGPYLTWTVTVRSQNSHLGQCAEEGSGRYYLWANFEAGSGRSIAANGDELWWDAYEIPGPQQTILTWTGGTGRFQNATGGLTFEYALVGEDQYEYGDGVPVRMVRTFTYRDTGTGTITY